MNTESKGAFTFEKEISTSGNSKMVRIPNAELKAAGLKEGDLVRVTIEQPADGYKETVEAARFSVNRFPDALKRLGG